MGEILKDLLPSFVAMGRLIFNIYLICICPSFLISKMEIPCTLHDYGKEYIHMRNNVCKLFSTALGTE